MSVQLRIISVFDTMVAERFSGGLKLMASTEDSFEYSDEL